MASVMSVLGVIADDLTGASDTAVQFARHGWKTMLLLGSAEGAPLEVPMNTRSAIAVTTDVRALDHVTAERLTGLAVDRMMAAGAGRIYLKVDSTVRGSVAGQVAGALSAWRRRHADASAIVCPAYPRMGRAVVQNHVLVDGRPVHETAAGRDPVTPVSGSDLSALIPGSASLTLERLSQQTVSDSAKIFTVDARTDDDLAALAVAIDRRGAAVIPVGSAGLAHALARQWAGARTTNPDLPKGRSDRVLLQVTSLNPVSLAQVERVVARFPDVVVVQGEARQTAKVFAELADRQQWDVFGLVGGDGARAALSALGATAIEIIDTILEGIPAGIVRGGRAEGAPVFTKAGGFGDPDALVRVIERITSE